MKFPLKDLIWTDMHNIAGNCTLQLSDGFIYLQGKRKERERKGVRGKEITPFCSMIFSRLKFNAYAISLNVFILRESLFSGWVLNIVSSIQKSHSKLWLPIRSPEMLKNTPYLGLSWDSVPQDLCEWGAGDSATQCGLRTTAFYAVCFLQSHAPVNGNLVKFTRTWYWKSLYNDAFSTRKPSSLLEMWIWIFFTLYLPPMMWMFTERCL